MYDRAADALLVVGVLAAAGLTAWWLAGRRAGRRTSPWLRVVAPVVLLVLIGLPLTWKLSKARTVQAGGRLVAHADTTRPIVALTFDDGPTPEGTEAALPLLQQYGVRATFFVTGRDLSLHMEEAQRIVAAGHELGNHSYSHAAMIGKPLSFIEREIEETDALIRQAGYEGEIHFRPPGCKKLFLLPLYLWRTGRTTVTWDLEPESYPDVAQDGDRIAAYVLDRVRPGSIILLHPMYANRGEVLQALPAIIEGLQERGYRFVTVSELLAS